MSRGRNKPSASGFDDDIDDYSWYTADVFPDGRYSRNGTADRSRDCRRSDVEHVRDAVLYTGALFDGYERKDAKINRCACGNNADDRKQHAAGKFGRCAG